MMEEVTEQDRLKIIIPDCCREGWEDCPHVANQPKKPRKQNIGL